MPDSKRTRKRKSELIQTNTKQIVPRYISRNKETKIWLQQMLSLCSTIWQGLVVEQFQFSTVYFMLVSLLDEKYNCLIFTVQLVISDKGHLLRATSNGQYTNLR